MAIVSLPSYGADPQTINASNLNGKVDPLATDYNGNIDNNNVAAAAAIAASKLNLTTIAQNIANSGTTTLSGANTLSGVTTMSAKAFIEAKGADVASAATTTIWVADGNFIHITGTTTITSFGTATQPGSHRTVVFDGALTLTHNSTSLILPTGANITTAAGDVAIVRAETTANARVVAYLRKDGTALVGFTPSATNALSGSVIQVLNNLVTASSSSATTIPEDNTIPQNTEGFQVLSKAITPNNSSNLLLIIANIAAYSSSTSIRPTAALFQDSTANALNVAKGSAAGSIDGSLVLIHYMTAGTTSSTTFAIRIGGGDAGTTTFNGRAAGRIYGGVMASSITITEYKA